MQTHLQVLTEDEKSQVHERSLKILARTGVRVDTAKGRRILETAGAQVDENTRIVRFPRDFVEAALDLAPKNFTLGARRPGWDKPMNAGDCSLLLDGEVRYLHIAGVGAFREQGMILDHRPLRDDWSSLNISDDLHRVWVAY